jgi:hypothetical protein
MKKQNYGLIAVILLLFLFDIILLYKNYRTKNDNLFLAAQMNKAAVKQDESKILKKAILFQQMAEATPCPDIEMGDPETKSKIRFMDLMKKEQTLLFFRFKETNCNGCIESTLSLLSDMSKNFPKKGIVILCGYRNVREFYAFAQLRKDQHLSVYNVNVLPVVAEEQEQPYLFVVDHEMKIQNVFIVNKGDSELTSEYLHCMGHKYWDIHVHNEHEHEHNSPIHH